MNDLLPCPFCGCTDILGAGPDAYDNFWYVCDDCGGSTCEAASEQEARARWNRRTTVAPSAWQLIASAPKSGYIIGAWKDGKWHCREMWWDDSVEEWTDTMSDRYLRPIWWTSLPPAD